jgi:hypothetical protein
MGKRRIPSREVKATVYVAFKSRDAMENFRSSAFSVGWHGDVWLQWGDPRYSLKGIGFFTPDGLLNYTESLKNVAGVDFNTSEIETGRV